MNLKKGLVLYILGHVLTAFCILCMLNQIKLVYGLFRQSNTQSTLDFCPKPTRKETNVPLHKKK